MKPIVKSVLLPAMLALAGCGTSDSTARLAELSGLISDSPRDLDGIWVSDGYGYLIVQAEEVFEFYHVTAEVCVAADVSDITLSNVFDTYRIGQSDDVVFLSNQPEPHEIAFNRVVALPDRCATPVSSSVSSTIDALTSFMLTHYAFFEERGVDWEAASQRLADAAATIRSDAELFETIRSELAAFNDAHVELTAYIGDETLRFDADPGVIRETLTRQAAESDIGYRALQTQLNRDLWVTGIGDTVLRGQGFSAGNDRIRYGMAADSVGYLAIRSMGGFIEDGAEPQTEAQAFGQALDDAINLFNHENANAVIVDLSINTGGYDYIARQLAERFASRPTPAYTLYAADSRIRRTYDYVITPSDRPRFEGRTIVLASRAAVSAAELAIICLDALDSVEIVGETTRGALSTKLAKLLPNGWELMLSNQVYIDHEGQAVEAIGIQPDTAFDVFIDDNLAENHLSAVMQTIDMALRQSRE